MRTAWAVLPYLALATFAMGHLWRYRHDQFRWTARSSQLHEQRVLRWASPLFHGGILLALAGHLPGLLAPAAATRAVGLSDGAYHAVALGVGGLSGTAAAVGLAALAYRRLRVRSVSRGSVSSDVVMYPLLAVTIGFGLWVTLFGDSHDYRETVAPWFRSIFALRPDVDAITRAPLGYRLHSLAALALIACWPFTRLVHVWSAPVEYLTRPYIVYRSRDPQVATRRGRPDHM